MGGNQAINQIAAFRRWESICAGAHAVADINHTSALRAIGRTGVDRRTQRGFHVSGRAQRHPLAAEPLQCRLDRQRPSARQNRALAGSPASPRQTIARGPAAPGRHQQRLQSGQALLAEAVRLAGRGVEHQHHIARLQAGFVMVGVRVDGIKDFAVGLGKSLGPGATVSGHIARRGERSLLRWHPDQARQRPQPMLRDRTFTRSPRDRYVLGMDAVDLDIVDLAVLDIVANSPSIFRAQRTPPCSACGGNSTLLIRRRNDRCEQLQFIQPASSMPRKKPQEAAGERAFGRFCRS